MRVRPLVLLTAVLAGLTASPAQAAPSEGPLVLTRYVVTLEPGSSPVAAAERAELLGGKVRHVYTHALKGYSVSLPQALLHRLLSDPAVAAVERDGVARATASQPRPPYGLDRIDQRALPLQGRYDYRSTGAGVTAYVVDTGIRTSHEDFGGRAVTGVDLVDGGAADDCNGHGTHVAGTLGGATYGVAKRVRLVAVRVLGCDGSGATSDIVAGVDWITGHHRPGTAAVANLSLGGPASAALDGAVQASIADGITYVVAAGNGDALGFPQDACRTSPARVTQAMTVGASDDTDEAAAFSNYGSCVDLYAPGVDVVSATGRADSGSRTLSGTSMASPHVAGVAALYLERRLAASPEAVASALDAASTKDVVRGAGGGGLLGGSGGSADLVFSRF